MVEAILILAYFMEGETWKLAENFQPKPVHYLTLRSDNGLSVSCRLK